MKSSVKIIALLSLFYFLFTSICGIVKVEILLTHVDNSILSMARLSSYVTLFISILTVIVYFIAIIGVIYFLLAILGSKPEDNVYTKAIKWFILFYFLNELTKTVIFIYMATKHIDFIIDSEESMLKMMEVIKWNAVSFVVDVITYCFSVLSFSYILLKKSKQIKIIDLIIVSLFMIILFVILHRNLFNFGIAK